MRRTQPATEVAARLCLVCGLCCDSTLFRDVEAQPGDDAARLRALGLPLRRVQRLGAGETKATTKLKFAQPCRLLDARCRCAIYADRPLRCQEFECALFKAVAAGRIATPVARRLIKNARQEADTVRALLRRLDPGAEARDVSLAFRRLQRRIHRRNLSRAEAACYSELTVAVHRLNLLLRRDFLPHPACPGKTPA